MTSARDPASQSTAPPVTGRPVEQSDQMPPGAWAEEAVEHHCAGCGYILRGRLSQHCPECGYDLAYLRRRESELAWPRRREMRSVRAYWRTIRTAIVHRRRFWEEISRPVSYHDAQSFRWVTVLVMYLPLVLLTGAGFLGYPQENDLSNGLVYEPVWTIAVTAMVHLCIVLFLAGITGLPSYFFHPRSLGVEEQNRAIALSYYCVAPLACMPVVYVSAILWITCMEREWLIGILGFGLFTVYMAVRILFEWLFELASLHKRATHVESTRYGLFFIVVPSLWIILGLIIATVIPSVVLMVTLVAISMW